MRGWFEAEVLAYDEGAGLRLCDAADGWSRTARRPGRRPPRHVAKAAARGAGAKGGTKAAANKPAAASGGAAPAAAPAAAKTKLSKAQARALTGKLIEIYWDGEGEWFEAEVLAYDEGAGLHFVRYTADSHECEEQLSGGADASPWRHVSKAAAKGAAAVSTAKPVSPAKVDAS